MKATIDGKRYDTDKCERLGDYGHQNNGNYTGTTHLLRANNGQLLVWENTNGQDLYFRDNLRAFLDESGDTIDSFDLTEEQEARCAELGLIEIIGNKS